MREPIKKTVKALGHTPPYQMHKYFARRPYNVFRNLIEHYTDEGDIVLDCFCGGGPTVFESLALERKVIGVDINPLATFITEMQIQQADLDRLEKYFYDFLGRCKEKYGADFEVEIGHARRSFEWMEWVYEVKCPKCGAVIRLDESRKISNGKYRCPNPACETNQQKKPGASRTACAPYRSVPVKVKYMLPSGEKEIHVFSGREQAELMENEENYELPRDVGGVDDKIPSNWDRWYEDCLPQKGVYKFSDLFTRRNYYANAMIFHDILSLPESEERDLLYFAFSASLRYTNKMSRVTEHWENGNPTCMDKHAYWLPNEYVECNVLQKLEDRMKAVLKGLAYTNKAMKTRKQKAESFDGLAAEKDYMILTQSSSKLPLPDESVDAIITDPPYGSNVQYAELSSFWNVWYMKYRGLPQFIYNEEEAVANRKSCFEGAKDASFYGNMLCSVYTEAHRVLKPDGYLVFTFNNKNINVWVQLLKAVVKAGFYLPEGGVIYQDFIKEYKNTSHLKYSGNIHGDFIYSFKKGEVPEPEAEEPDDFETAVERKINGCIDGMFQREAAYTTTELYERIYGSLIRMLMQYIKAEVQKDIGYISELSNTYIDDILSRKLELKDGKWVMKGERDAG